jgi:hypothetical protein
MAKAPRPWIVGPHQPIEKIDDNLWSVTAPIPGLPVMVRRMSIVRLSDGRIAFHDSFPVDEATLAAIRAWGTPAIQIVTNSQHMLQVHAFREKLGLKTYCPRDCADKVRARIAVDGTFEDLPKDPALEVRPTAGLKSGEAWFLVRTADRISLLTADTVMWVPKGNLLLKLMGFVGERPKVATPIFKFVAMKDKRAFRASFERLLDDVPDLTRVVPCHGAAIDRDPVGALRAGIAASL